MLLTMGLTILTLSARASAPPQRQSPNAQLDNRQMVLFGSEVTFADALKSIADQLKFNVVADDLPLRPHAPVNARGSAKLVLDSVAGQFDCKWILTERGGILFSKRFSDDNELPQVLLEEIREMADGISALLFGLGIHPNSSEWAVELRRLFGSFTRNQLTKLEEVEALSASELSGPQRVSVHRVIAQRGFSSFFGIWELLQSQMESLETSFIELSPRFNNPPLGNSHQATGPLIQKSDTSLQLQYVSQDRGNIVRVPLPHTPRLIIRMSNTTSGIPLRSGRPSRRVVPEEYQAIVRASFDETKRRLEVTRIQLRLGQTTLASALTSLSEQTAIRVEAAEYLRNRRLVLFIGDMPAAAALDMICQANGWVWHESRSGGVILERPHPKNPRGFSQVVTAIRSCLPSDWKRYFGESAGAAQGVGPSTVDLKAAGVYAERVMVPAVRRRLEKRASSYGDRLKSAVRDFGENGTKLLCKSLSEEQKRDLVTCLALDTFAQLFEGTDNGLIMLGELPLSQREPDSAEVVVKDGSIGLRWTDERAGQHLERAFNTQLVPRR